MGHRGYTLAPMQFDGMTVGDIPAATWAAGRTPGQQQSFNVDLGAVAGRFAESVVESCGASMGVQVVADGAPTDSIVIRPTLIRVDPQNSGLVEPDHRLTVRFFTSRGEPLDVILLHANGAGFGAYALGTRMRFAGTHFGQDLCAYLRSRFNG